MSADSAVDPALRQGSAQPWRERMPLPPQAALSAAQRAAPRP